MKVGIYIDGFNVYYGGKGLARKLANGRRQAGADGWKWLDFRALGERLVDAATEWPGASIGRVVYCTAPVMGHSRSRQELYFRALRASRSVDHLELGQFFEKVQEGPLATKNEKGRPNIVEVQKNWRISDIPGMVVQRRRIIASISRREEKGSDVNVATHLTTDILTRAVDAAIVISNDTDLKLPIQRARQVVPVGTVNPSPRHTAGALRGDPAEGVGSHWWRSLTLADFQACQLPDAVGELRRPTGW